MSSVAHGVAVIGVEGVPVSVEVDLLRRLPSVVIIGLPSTSVRESADRVRSAMLASGFEFPRQRVVVGLAPADLRKDGTALDLPIAVGVLSAAGHIAAEALSSRIFFGELALDGRLRGTRGALAAACSARDHGFDAVVVPAENAREALLVTDVRVEAAETLADVVGILRGDQSPLRVPPAPLVEGGTGLDLRDVRGQLEAREALEVAAAGGHNLLLEGPPGCGKTMLAARLPSILPRMTPREALETTRIHSVAGLLPAATGILDVRPFRAPHHSVSTAGLVGGAALRPGEASLAHNGVLFLDEFPEFPRCSREVLRGPLEDRRVVLARAGGTVTMPADFTLVAAANPCPCGMYGHPTRPCTCSPTFRDRYRSRLSGPIVDRIDLRVELGPVAAETLLDRRDGESSAEVRERVERARARQRARYGDACATNAALPPERVLDACDPTTAALSSLRALLERDGSSARVGRRLLKVARSIADLDAAVRVDVPHVGRAVRLRAMPWEA